MKGEDIKFVRQSQTIKVTNVDNKVQTEKETQAWKYAVVSIRGIICGPSNCGKTNVLISLLESPYNMFRERVRILEVVAK